MPKKKVLGREHPSLPWMLSLMPLWVLKNPDISVMLPAYVEKYGAMMQDMGSTPESMAADYSLGIRVTPTKFRSWA